MSRSLRGDRWRPREFLVAKCLGLAMTTNKEYPVSPLLAARKVVAILPYVPVHYEATYGEQLPLAELAEKITPHKRRRNAATEHRSHQELQGIVKMLLSGGGPCDLERMRDLISARPSVAKDQFIYVLSARRKVDGVKLVKLGLTENREDRWGAIAYGYDVELLRDALLTPAGTDRMMAEQLERAAHAKLASLGYPPVMGKEFFTCSEMTAVVALAFAFSSHGMVFPTDAFIADGLRPQVQNMMVPAFVAAPG